jgi:two-component system phosphate regulon sensor histidine kinase PhoR
MTAMDIEEGRLRLEKEPTIFEDVVRSACLSMRPRYELKEFKHVHDFPDAQSTPVNIDIARIREVVIRLLENAVAYTKEGGQLTTRVFKTDSKVRYELSDTGIGIPKAEQTMIFERFRRGSNAIAMKPDGVGLGLYITQSIIESHGGRIGVTSEEGKGSTFWFELPLADKMGGVDIDV